MLLNAAASQLLVVDVQERLLPAMAQGDAMVERCALLMQAADALKIPIVVSEQYRKGLGATVGRLDVLRGGAPVFEKLHFSCAADEPLAGHVAATHRRQIVLCGIEAHVCVLQSALGFRQKGLEVFVVADAVTARATESVALALQRMAGNGVQVINAEMAIFEWLHVAGGEVFKTVSKLIK